MINKVSFTGRETMLTDKLAKPIEQEFVRASTYIEEKVAPKVYKTAKTPEYFSFSAPIETAVNLEKSAETVSVGNNLELFG